MILATAAAVAALALAAPAKPIPDRDVGLAKTAPMEVAAPPRVKENDSPPGERPVRSRAYPGAPPAVPGRLLD